MTDGTWLFSVEDSLFSFLKIYIFSLFQKEKLEFLNYISEFGGGIFLDCAF